MTRWLGLDIGGANLKVADTGNFAKSMAFPLWKSPDYLGAAIARLLTAAPPFEALALTITGELADCFETREEGVVRILDQLTQVVPGGLVKVYTVAGDWLTIGQAARKPWDVAASNWHAMASYAGRFCETDCYLSIDIGSTTSDIIPIRSGVIATQARTDSDRLQAYQLVYSGVERTPLCSVVRSLPLHSINTPVMNELFATMRDVYLWIGELPEEPESRDSADGRPNTRRQAAFRLARMVGEDGSTLLEEDIDAIAEAASHAQAELLARAIDLQRMQLGYADCQTIVVSGHGDFLVDAALRILEWNPQRVSLQQSLGKEIARCSTARAVACLAEVPLPNSRSQTVSPKECSAESETPPSQPRNKKRRMSDS